MINFIDKTSTTDGTPINRKNLMGMQGFDSEVKTYENGKIIFKNSANDVLTYEFAVNTDGTIDTNKVIVTFVSGGKLIRKTRTYNADNTYTEVVE